MSLPGGAVHVSDHIEIECSVRYNGVWTPVFVCSPDVPRITINQTNQTNQTSSNHVLNSRVIAAADIEDFAVFNCSMTFTLDADQVEASETSVKSEDPVYDFMWQKSVIRVVNVSGEYEFTQTYIDLYAVCCSNSIMFIC